MDVKMDIVEALNLMLIAILSNIASIIDLNE